jgi:hypothetical protein
MKRSVLWACLGAVLVLGLAACTGDDGGGDTLPDAVGPDAAADVTQDVPADPGTPDVLVDPGIPDPGTPDPGEEPDTVEPADPGVDPDADPTDVPGTDVVEDVPKPTSPACIGCHTDQATLQVLAPDDGTEPETGGG